MKRVVRRAISAGCSVAITVSLLTSSWPCFRVSAASFGTRQGLQATAAQRSVNIYSTSAVASSRGVLLRWLSDTSKEILGFNIYRVSDEQRIKINREVVPGSVFISERQAELQSRTPYAFFDRAGDRNSIYLIEAVSVSGDISATTSVAAVTDQRLDEGVVSSISPTAGTGSDQSQYSSAPEFTHPAGALEDQWAIAAQSALKIGIKRDGWYKVTHQQVTAAGFSPVVDVRNLRLFVDGREVQILTSKSSGTFSSGDSFEFYGLGLDTPTTDTRTYYLIAGTHPGRRIAGELRSTQASVLSFPGPTELPDFSLLPNLWYGFILQFITGVGDIRDKAPVQSNKASKPSQIAPSKFRLVDEQSLKSKTAVRPKKKTTAKTKAKIERSHAVVTPSRTFTYSVERKDRLVYFVSLLNGDAENYFGQVISSTAVTQNIRTPNPDVTAGETARLEVALQGVGVVPHQVDVTLNNVLLGSVSYFGLGRGIETFNVPLSLLNDGDNALKFNSTIPNTVSLIDFTRLSYPRILRAENNSLRFTSRPIQTLKVDGFTISNLRLLDCTDPFALTLTTPNTDASASGYAITVEPSAIRAKGRLLYAFPDTQSDTPASFSLNQPSTLNLNSNGADLLVIAHKDLIPAAAPLVTLRQSQGLQVVVVDVEDVYDEFTFGVHGPQAIRNLLERANTAWSRAPRYVVLLGDASLDPRNYQGAGNFDLVPTKLVDATFSETASDDWLSDFDNDGIADIPLGRLPARTPAEANVLVSKIVNFLPSNVPQSALLVADDPTNFYFDFEAANDEVQSLLPGSITVNRVNRRTDPNARNNVITRFNSGQVLVNYTGHGNVDTWTGANIFTSSDATVLTNGNKLPLVVVMDCLNGYYQDPLLLGLAEALVKAPAGGAVSVFASSGLTVPDGQHAMARQLYLLLFSAQPIAVGDACKMAKAATTDMDVRRTWILFGDPSMKIR